MGITEINIGPHAKYLKSCAKKRKENRNLVGENNARSGRNKIDKKSPRHMIVFGTKSTYVQFLIIFQLHYSYLVTIIMVLKCFLIHRPKQCKYIYLSKCTSFDRRRESLHTVHNASNQSTSSCEPYISEKCRAETREHTELFTVIKLPTVAR